MQSFDKYLKPNTIWGWILPLTISLAALFNDAYIALFDPMVVQKRIPLILLLIVITSFIVLALLLFTGRLWARSWDLCGHARSAAIIVISILMSLNWSLEVHRSRIGGTALSFSILVALISFALVVAIKKDGKIFGVKRFDDID